MRIELGCLRRRRVPVGLLAVALLAVLGVPSAGAATVTLTDVPSPAVAILAHGELVNDEGDVAGPTNVGVGPYSAFVWTADGVFTDLRPLLPGPTSGLALSARGALTGGTRVDNNTIEVFTYDRVNGVRGGGTMGGFEADGVGFVGDTIVGESTLANGQWRGFQWDGSGPLVDLGTLDGGLTRPAIVGANGIVAGLSQTSDGHTHLVRWVRLGAPEDLGILPADSPQQRVLSGVMADDGTIYGRFNDFVGGVRQFRWEPTTRTLQTWATPDGVQLTTVNRHGQWAGTRCTATTNTFCTAYEIVRWQPGDTLQVLPTGSVNSMPALITDKGQIIGINRPGDIASDTAFVWDPNCGFTDLSGYGTMDPESISANGTIAGTRRTPVTAPFHLHLDLEPCTPTAVSAQADTVPRVAWHAPDGRDAPVSGYRIYRDDELVATVDGKVTTWQDGEQLTGPHAYAVAATNANGESNHSAPVVVDVGAEVLTPEPVAADAVTANPVFTG